MSPPVRWILLLAVAGVVTGVVLWLGGGGEEPADGGHVVAPRGAEAGRAGRAMEPPPPVAGSDLASAVTPEELVVPALSAPDAERLASGQDGPRVTVIGRLVSRHGRPIEGARVSLLNGPAPGMQAMLIRGAAGDDDNVSLGIGHSNTDRDGAFRIEAPLPDPSEEEELPAVLDEMLASGPRVFVEHADFVTGDHAVPALVEGVVDAGTLVSQGAGRIVGRVLAGAGSSGTGSELGTSPVVGARLAAQPAAGDTLGLEDIFGLISGDSEREMSTATTDDDGVFELGGLPAGDYQLAVHAAGRPRLQLENVQVVVGRATAVGDLLLERGSALGGVVRDASGEPAPGLRVRAQRDMAEGLEALADLSMRLMLGDTQETTETDEEGLFHFDGISEGSYDLTVAGRDSGWGEVTLADVPDGTIDIELVAHRLGDLLITVTGRSGGPKLTTVELEAERVDDEESLVVMGGGALASPSAEPLPDGMSLSDGVFLVQGAGREGTDLAVRAVGYATARLRVGPVLDAEQVEQMVMLVPESRVEGVVLDDRGAPVAGAEVEARNTSDASGVGQAGLPGSSLSYTRSVDGSGEDDARMLDLLGLSGGERVKALSDQDGGFWLAGLGAGDWEVGASAEDFVSSSPQLLALGESDVVDGLQLVLAPGGTVLGTVLEAGGLPVAGAHLHIASAEQGGLSLLDGGLNEDDLRESLERNLAASFGIASEEQVTVRTDDRGNYEARGLAPGEYSVTLKKESKSPINLNLGSLLGAPPPDDGRTQWVVVRAREDVRADFMRSPRAAVTVRVTAGGRPVAGATVSVADTASSMFGIDLSFGGNSETTDEEGLARFEDLEPATYKVTASVPGAVHVEDATVELDAGRDELVEVGFGGVSLLGRVLDEGGKPVPGVDVNLVRQEPDDDSEASGGFLSDLFGGGSGGGSGGLKVTMSVTGDAGEDRVTRGGAELFGLAGERVATDGEGRFEMKYLSPGDWQLSAGGGVWIAGEPVVVEIDEETAPEEATLHVRRGATIQGQVIEGSTEDPLDDVKVQLQRDDGGTEQSTTSSEGTYRFEGVPNGDFTLLIDGPDGPRAQRDVHVTDGGATITAHLVTLD